MSNGGTVAGPAPERVRRRRRRRLKVLAGLAVAYGLLMTFGGCADKLILFPSTGPVHAYNARPQTIPFHGGQLEIWVSRSPGAARPGAEPVAYLLEFTGNATRAEDIAGFVAERWGERPVEAWVVNYPGYGRSTGPARLRAMPPAGLTAYDALAAVANGRPIVVGGNSIGCTVALHVAANRPVAGAVLQNPPALRSIVLRDFGWWNLWLLAGPIALQIPGDLDAPTNAARTTAPAVFIMSDSDELVRPAIAKRTLDAYAGPKRVITLRGKGHNDSLETRAELGEFHAALDWLVPPAATGTGTSPETARPPANTPDLPTSVAPPKP